VIAIGAIFIVSTVVVSWRKKSGVSVMQNDTNQLGAGDATMLSARVIIASDSEHHQRQLPLILQPIQHRVIQPINLLPILGKQK